MPATGTGLAEGKGISSNVKPNRVVTNNQNSLGQRPRRPCAGGTRFGNYLQRRSIYSFANVPAGLGPVERGLATTVAARFSTSPLNLSPTYLRRVGEIELQVLGVAAGEFVPDLDPIMNGKGARATLLDTRAG